MIDNLSLAISHGLMLLAAWLLLRRPDLEHEPDPRDAVLRKRRRSGKRGLESGESEPGDSPGA